MGRRGYGDGGRGRVYTYRCTVTTRMTCIKMGSDESHSVNVSLIVRYKVTRQCSQCVLFLFFVLFCVFFIQCDGHAVIPSDRFHTSHIFYFFNRGALCFRYLVASFLLLRQKCITWLALYGKE